MTADIPAPHRLDPVEPREDEISLADIIAVLVRRKWLFLGVWAAVVAAAGIYLAVTPTSYRYFGVISLGRVPEQATDGSLKLTLIEDPATATARVKDGYIPVVNAIRDGGTYQPKITVKNPRNTTLLIMETYAPDDSAAGAVDVLRQVGDRLIGDHRKISSYAARRLRARLDAARIRLAELQDDRLFETRMRQHQHAIEDLKRQREAMADRRRLVRKSIEDTSARLELARDELARLDRQLADLEASRKQVLNAGSDPTRAMSILLIATQIDRVEDRRSKLERALQIAIPQQKRSLEKELRDLDRKAASLAESLKTAEAKLQALLAGRERSIEKQKTAVAEAEALLAAVQPTQWTQSPQKDSIEKWPKAAVIFVFAILGGLIIALFAVFIVQAIVQSGRREYN